MELNYITFIQENLASFFDFEESIRKKGVPEDLLLSFKPANFHKGNKKRQISN